jgi:hypothetical protein
VIVPVEAGVLAAAVKVIGCPAPGLSVNVDGDAVTPVGTPLNEMFTVPVKPFVAVAEIETC